MATQPTTALSTGAQVAADALVAEDVRYFFNLPGNGLGPLLNALFDYPSMSYVLALHEGPLVAMADGYARASGKVGFANVYMVPGTANALSSIYTAHRDKSPIVVTATQQSRRIVGRDAYASSTDLVGAVRQFTKWAWEVPTPERLPEALHRAFQMAATPPYGPVFLTIPSDLLAAEIDLPLNEPSRPTAVPALGPPDAATVRAVADRIVAAERILIICGHDVVRNEAVEEVEALASDIGAAVVSEPWNGLVAFPRPHALGFGEYNRDILERVQPDVIVGLGARMFVEALGVPDPAFPEGTSLVALGQDPEELGRMFPSDVSATCDVRLAVEAVREACRGRVDARRRAARLAAIEQYQEEIAADRRGMLAEHRDRRPMTISTLAVELNKAIDRDTLIVEQSTTSGGMLRAFLEQRNPYNAISTGGSVQGWATGAAIGAQLGRPDQPVLAILGDGGFAFGSQAIWTAAHYDIPVTWLVLENRGYRSMRRTVHARSEETTAANPDFGFDFNVEIPQMARAMGVRADRITEPGDLADAVRAALDGDRPQVIEASIASGVEFVKSHGHPMAI